MTLDAPSDAIVDTMTAPGLQPLPDLAKSTAVRRLTGALVERGLHEHAASAIAVSVCDPTTVRRQLTAPGRLRVDGGFLEVVQTDVWTQALLPLPTNPRAIPAFSYAIEAEANRRPPLPALAGSPDPDAVELLMPAVSSADLVGALDAQVDYLRRANDLRESVGQLGIREPMLLVPLVIDLRWADYVEQDATADPADVDGIDSPAILATVDGSSRLTAAHHLLNIEPSDVLFNFLGNERGLRQRISQSLGRYDAETLTNEELSARRAMLAPATIVIGFDADDPETDTLLGAINSRLGALHVDPPRPWSPASRLDVQLDTAIDALLEADRISEDASEWVRGRLTVEEVEAAGFRTEPDVRAAYILEQIGEQDSVTGRALRVLTARSRITRQMRAAIAAEGALRSFRSRLNDAQSQAARSLLTAIYLMDELQGPWTINTHEGTGDLTQSAEYAFEELRSLGAPGPYIRVVLAQAGYWLARLRVVPRQTRGGQADRRDITAVLTLMINSKHGLLQLLRIIQDGRSGEPPRRVTEAGEILDGPVDDDWLRTTWSAGARQKPPPTSPESALNAATVELQGAVNDVLAKVEALRSPRTGSGTPLVDQVGIEAAVVDAMLATLAKVQRRLNVLEHISTERAADTTERADGTGMGPTRVG